MGQGKTDYRTIRSTMMESIADVCHQKNKAAQRKNRAE
jgi:hypothetical protein